MRCGLCCAHALTEWWHMDWDLERWLCGHHAHEKAQQMVDAGWALIEDERVEDLPPPLPALTSDPATH